jgi:transposase
VVETCRRLKIPIRDYLGSVLPGLLDRKLNQISALTPVAWPDATNLSTPRPV